MDEEKNIKLFEEVKTYVRVTWDEEDQEIYALVIEAEKYLSEKVGAEIDFEKDLIARRLLKEYCRYVRNYSKEYFEQNFLDDIVFLQLKYASEEISDGES